MNANTPDFKQETEALGNPKIPSLEGMTEHRAIDDAKDLRHRREWLAAHYLDGKPRWPSMRLIRDVDDFEVSVTEDADIKLRCPANCGGKAFWDDYPVTMSTLLAAAYGHIDSHKAAGR